MIAWLLAIEFVAGYPGIRDGQGSSREDNMYDEPLCEVPCPVGQGRE
jgi:hypothetical protein